MRDDHTLKKGVGTGSGSLSQRWIRAKMSLVPSYFVCWMAACMCCGSNCNAAQINMPFPFISLQGGLVYMGLMFFFIKNVRIKKSTSYFVSPSKCSEGQSTNVQKFTAKPVPADAYLKELGSSCVETHKRIREKYSHLVSMTGLFYI
jgi:hypothetical protein